VTIVDKPAEYAQAARILDWLRAQLCVIPGNRDDRLAFWAAFAARLPANCHREFVQYAIVREHACAIMLDTVSTQSKKGRLCKARLAHLGEMLNDAGNRQVVVFMHHPPFEIAEAPEPFQFEDRGNRDDFSGIVSRYRNARHIYCGHSHRTASGKIAGIDASTIPSVAADLRKGRPAGMQEGIVRLIEF
jgi:3',5'-cyclic AMP phosphodiesterase CpdA